MSGHAFLFLPISKEAQKGTYVTGEKNGLHKREKLTGAYGFETGMQIDSLFKGCCLPNQKAGKIISRSASTKA